MSDPKEINDPAALFEHCKRYTDKKKTYSEAVTIAMKEYIRINEFSKIFEFQGTGIWSGDLSDMRKDSKTAKSKTKKKTK